MSKSNTIFKWRVAALIRPYLKGLEIEKMKLKECDIAIKGHSEKNFETEIELFVEADDGFNAQKKAEDYLKCYTGIIAVLMCQPYAYKIGGASAIDVVSGNFEGIYLPCISEGKKISVFSTHYAPSINQDLLEIANFIDKSKDDRLKCSMQFIYDFFNALTPEHAFLSGWVALTLLIDDLGRGCESTVQRASLAFRKLKDKGLIDEKMENEWSRDFNDIYKKRQDVFFKGHRIESKDSKLLSLMKELLKVYIKFKKII